MKIYRQLSGFLLLNTCIFLQAQVLKSDTTSKQESKIFELGKIETTDTLKADENSVVETISAKDIQNSGSNDIAQSLRYSQGVFFTPAQGSRGEPTIGIRGFNSTQVGLFFDGIPVGSIYDRQTDFSQFSAFGVSEISISKGFTSPIYGINTLGGAINIVSSRPKEKLEMKAKYQFIANNENIIAYEIGSNMGKYYLYGSYSFDHRDSYNLSANFKPTTYQGAGEKLNSDYTNHTLRAKVGYTPNEMHEYSLNLIYQKGSKGGLLDANTGGRFWKWPNYDKFTLYILGNSFINEKMQINTKLYYDSFYNKLDSYGRLSNSTTIPSTLSFSSIYDDKTFGGVVTFDYNIKETINFKTGINLKQDNHKNYDPTATSDPATKISDLSTSIFTQYAQEFIKYLRFVGSASYDRNDVLSASVYTSANIFDTSKVRLQGFSLQGILYAQLNSTDYLYLNIGKKNKLPTLKERYSTTWGLRTPNPNLQPESAINYEIGLSYQTKIENKTTLNLATYFIDLNQMILSIADSSNSCLAGSNCTKLINANEGYNYGVEFGIKQNLFHNSLQLGLNYNYVQKKVTNKDSQNYGISGDRILDYPNHILNFSTMYSPTKDIDFILMGTYQSAMWILETINNISNYTKNKDIFLMDLRMNFRFLKHYQVSTGAYNLLDANYYYSSGYYMPGRRFYIELSYNF